MSRLLDHARDELKIAGYDIDSPIKDEFESDDDYANACAKNAFDMLKVFSEADHSGFSASVTLQLFNRLAEFKCLTPLSNDPDEWCDISKDAGFPEKTYYQSKRQCSCFSDDGLKTYYDIDEEANRIYGVDENGNKFSKSKPKSEYVLHKLEERKCV